ncbi:nucleotidyltransferase family protein [Winogradskyella sp. 3972H.M.0a.05]|uniref:nucleotidyltransferase family protein n=1 Tax=Winogradskyella sp. 3972H.M.0a.05 TaxID=2950277 RepID=UPI003399988F
MSSKKETYQVIADILSFDSNSEALKTTILSEKMDWNNLVKIGSDHLVLPAIYCRLNSKNLLDFLPKDLQSFLHEITQINRNRNESLVNEAYQIASTFNAAKIDYVFLKGLALIIGGYYEDIAERMIGDIDILVKEDQAHIAQDLLIKSGYKPLEKSLSFDYIEQKHLPRLLPESALGAVEIHKKVLKSSINLILNEDDILSNKVYSNGHPTPNEIYLLRHNILSYQYDDLGAYYNSISLKNIYDSVSIVKKHHHVISEVSNKTFKNYFALASIFFKDFTYSFLTIKHKIYRFLFLFKTNNRIFNGLWHNWLNGFRMVRVYFDRFLLIISNKSYRNRLLSSKIRF